MWFFSRHDGKQLQRLYKGQPSEGKMCLPHTSLGAQPGHPSLWGDLQSRTHAPWPVMLFPYLHSQPWQQIHFWGFHLRSWAENFFRTPAETSLWWIDRKTSKTLFATLTQHPVLFHSSSSPSTSSISESINMAEPFCSGLPRWWWPPYLCWSIWPSNGTLFHRRKWNQAEFVPSFGL